MLCKLKYTHWGYVGIACEQSPKLEVHEKCKYINKGGKMPSLATCLYKHYVGQLFGYCLYEDDVCAQVLHNLQGGSRCLGRSHCLPHGSCIKLPSYTHSSTGSGAAGGGLPKCCCSNRLCSRRILLCSLRVSMISLAQMGTISIQW